MTLREIAKLANVSRSAVSLALNGRAGVSDETRQKVLGIAREHGYIPRSIVKAEQVYKPVRAVRVLACVKSEVVGPEFHHAPFFAELIQGLQIENRRRGHYSLVFSTVTDESLQNQLAEIEADHPSEGIVLLGTNLSAKEVAAVQEVHENVVLLDAFFPTLNIDTVVMNNFMGAAQAVDHLAELGHSSVGYVGSHTRIQNFDQRWSAFRKEIDKKSISFNEKHKWLVTPTIEQSEEELSAELPKTKSLPSAVFCENDYLAIGLTKACNKIGIRVPGQLSIVGFDDIPQCTVVQPELTTIRVDKASMAEAAVSRLLHLVDNGGAGDQTSLSCLVSTRIVQRTSTTANDKQS